MTKEDKRKYDQVVGDGEAFELLDKKGKTVFIKEKKKPQPIADGEATGDIYLNKTPVQLGDEIKAALDEELKNQADCPVLNLLYH